MASRDLCGMDQVHILRSALRRTYPRIADQVSDAEIKVMLGEARQRAGADSTDDKLLEIALARAADVASERALGRKKRIP